MKVPYFAVFDHQTRSYGQIFPSQTEGSAVRSFQMSVNDSQSMPSKYPEDFALFQVGEFEDETGSFNSFEPPKLVCNATALLKS